MNIIDIILVIIILSAVWNGVSKGFFTGMAGLISWLGTLLLSFWLYRHLAGFLETHVNSSIWMVPLSFLGSLLIIGTLLSLFMGRILLVIPLSAQQHKMNKLLGFVPGIVVGTLYAAIIAALLLLLPISATLTAHTRDSIVAQRLTAGMEYIEQAFTPVFGKEVNRSINRMTIAPESTESVPLPFTVTAPKPRPDLEREMLELINGEREKAGLSLLKRDEELIPVARQHSRDMFARSYFSHISPEGNTPFDRIRQANVSFLTAGENLAIAQTLQLAHEGLMNSPGHRANILRPAFGRIGIGILDGGVHGLMVTQNFRN